MSLLRKLFPGVPAQKPSAFYTFAVQCSRCGETIEGQVNLANDPSADYEGDRIVYHVRKVLMGNGRCFQQVEVEFSFDSSYNVMDRQISGGRFIEAS